jgi:hypothetical protein
MIKDVGHGAHHARIGRDRLFLWQPQDVHVDDRNCIEQENGREAQLLIDIGIRNAVDLAL